MILIHVVGDIIFLQWDGEVLQFRVGLRKCLELMLRHVPTISYLPIHKLGTLCG
jgi:hypothetical protein